MDTTFTYEGDLSVPRDFIRLNIGDSNPAAPLLYDVEIASILAIANDNTSEAIMKCMDAILLKLARECSYTIGPEHVSAKERYNNYKEFMKDHNGDYTIANTIPYDPNTDTHTAIFTVGMMDYGSPS